LQLHAVLANVQWNIVVEGAAHALMHLESVHSFAGWPPPHLGTSTSDAFSA
jgi:hypothetical protein